MCPNPPGVCLQPHGVCAEIDEDDIFEDLPQHIRSEVATVLTKDMMECSPVFSTLLESERTAVAGNLLQHATDLVFSGLASGFGRRQSVHRAYFGWGSLLMRNPSTLVMPIFTCTALRFIGYYAPGNVLIFVWPECGHLRFDVEWTI